MKLDRLSKLVPFFSLPIAFSLSGCLSSGNSADGGVNNATTTGTEVRAPVEADCQTIGYNAVRSLVVDNMQIPEDTVLDGGIVLDDFLLANIGALGSTGVNENRSCSLLYFKASAQLGMLSCHWVAQNNPSLLFPSGLSDYGTAFQTLTGLQIDSTESAALSELTDSITSFDSGVFASLEVKKMAAACSAIFASMVSQTL